jgi:hypothetical protein
MDRSVTPECFLVRATIAPVSRTTFSRRALTSFAARPFLSSTITEPLDGMARSLDMQAGMKTLLASAVWSGFSSVCLGFLAAVVLAGCGPGDDDLGEGCSGTVEGCPLPAADGVSAIAAPWSAVYPEDPNTEALANIVLVVSNRPQACGPVEAPSCGQWKLRMTLPPELQGAGTVPFGETGVGYEQGAEDCPHGEGDVSDSKGEVVIESSDASELRFHLTVPRAFSMYGFNPSGQYVAMRCPM